MFIEYELSCNKIWKAYQRFATRATVFRSGFCLTHVMCPFGFDKATEGGIPFRDLSDGDLIYRRGESVLEHQAKVAWLASAFYSNFPRFFNEGGNYNLLLPADAWNVIIAGLIHDVGEDLDIPDDGRVIHALKDKLELKTLNEFVSVYSDADAERILALFKSFQDKDSYTGKALYALDKLDAVLTLLLMEKNGIVGSVAVKPETSRQDFHFGSITKTLCATDIWAAHLVACIREYSLDIKEPVLELLTTAVLDVRGLVFKWKYEDCVPYDPR